MTTRPLMVILKIYLRLKTGFRFLRYSIRATNFLRDYSLAAFESLAYKILLITRASFVRNVDFIISKSVNTTAS
jgi:hypothetical protein